MAPTRGIHLLPRLADPRPPPLPLLRQTLAYTDHRPRALSQSASLRIRARLGLTPPTSAGDTATERKPGARAMRTSSVLHLSVTHLSTWGSSLSSRHLPHRPQAVPSNPGSARLTSALHSETATERWKRAAVRLRRGWVEARVGRATQPARGTIAMCTSGAERETASESGGNAQARSAVRCG
ncbi:hypothetical protein B0H13DRAFT_2676667 [Mycena leptocephala]|nr:hypothetical protein B0H13DRAFT_2676667 [Mycena leptocephala]